MNECIFLLECINKACAGNEQEQSPQAAAFHSHTPPPTDCECRHAAGRQFLVDKTLCKRITVACQAHIGTGSTNTRRRRGEEREEDGRHYHDNDNNDNSAVSLSDRRAAPLDKHDAEQAFQSRLEILQRRIRLLLKYSVVAGVAVMVAGLIAATPLAANASSVGQSVS